MAQLQAILKYQEIDAKIFKIERELSASEERKEYVKVKKLLESAPEKLDALEMKARSLRAEADELMKQYERLEETLKDFDNLDELVTGGADISFYRKKAQLKIEQLKKMRADLTALTAAIKATDEEYQKAKKQILSVEKKAPEIIKKYKELKAAKDAVADLDRCEMKIARTETHELNYVRRCFKADGSLIADCVINLSKEPVVRHETDADEQIQLLMFDRVNGKDILLMNWQCHVTAASGREKTKLSPDYVGALRNKMEKEADVHFAFHQGAGANIEPNSYIESEPDNRDYKNHGAKIAAIALKALENMESVASGKVRAVKKTVSCAHDLDVSAYNLQEAQQITDLKNANDFEKAKSLCIQYGYNSPYHASAVVARSKRKETETKMEISAIAIGDVGFTAAPYEMFDTNGMQIKAKSSYGMTFVCAYSNGRYGYIPSSIAWDSGGYEVDTCKFVKGTGEMLANEFVGLLNELK